MGPENRGIERKDKGSIDKREDRKGEKELVRRRVKSRRNADEARRKWSLRIEREIKTEKRQGKHRQE